MSDYPQRRGEVVQSEGSEGWTIYEPETDSLHVLNDSARAIWELCDGKTAQEEMAEALSELTQLNKALATDQVAKALHSLKKARLITYKDR